MSPSPIPQNLASELLSAEMKVDGENVPKPTSNDEMEENSDQVLIRVAYPNG